MNDTEIQSIAAQYASHYETRALLSSTMNDEKTSMVDYAREHPEAFCGKRVHFRQGVFVQLVTRQYVRFTRDKVSHDWISRMAAAGNAAAIVIRLDPKKLCADETTLALLREIDYHTSVKEVASASKNRQYALFEEDPPASASAEAVAAAVETVAAAAETAAAAV